MKRVIQSEDFVAAAQDGDLSKDQSLQKIMNQNLCITMKNPLGFLDYVVVGQKLKCMIMKRNY